MGCKKKLVGNKMVIKMVLVVWVVVVAGVNYMHVTIHMNVDSCVSAMF